MSTLSDLVRIVSQATERRRAYAAWVVREHRVIHLGGLDPTRPVPLELSLADLYVPLKGRRARPDGDEAARLHVGGRPLDDRVVAERVGEPELLIDLLRQGRDLIVLGDPGAGKSTFLRHLALSTACALLAERADLGVPAPCESFADAGLGRRLPLLVPLGAYAKATARTKATLDAFLVRYYETHRRLPMPVAWMIRDALAAGTALLLLDGLDEAGSATARGRVVREVMDFHARHSRAGNRFVITSRIDGYHEVRPAAPDLVECTVLDFDERDREAFVHAFARATCGAGPELGAAEDELSGRLLTTIRTNEGVRHLSVNPLMLTVLALFARQGTPLSERRVELYDHLTNGFVGYWTVQRGQHGNAPSVDPDVARAALEAVAARVQDAGGARGLVRLAVVETAVVGLFRRRAEPDLAARQFVRALRSEVGILAERGAGQFGFLHLTLQEYLAAAGIVRQGLRPLDRSRAAASPVLRIADLLAPRLGDAAWRDVVRLAVGELGVVREQPDLAGALATTLIARGQTQPGVPPGRAAALVGEAVADALPGGVTEPWKGRVLTAVLEAMIAPHVDPRERVTCGNALARLGDHRFHRPERWCLPNDCACGRSEDHFGFTRIERGDFVLGSDRNDDPEAYEDEAPQRAVPLDYDYWIARWPVTVAQFRVFVECTGTRPGDPRCLEGLANHPLVRVSWHEAVAYCEWLTRELQASAHTPVPLRSLLLASRGSECVWAVRLPSEAEWERAARGREGRRYPWGNGAPTPERANFYKTEIRGTSAVGCFPAGATPEGVEELAGNVWEWTRSKHDKYPYSAEGGREDLDGDALRVRRGGAFVVEAGALRSAGRGGGDPNGRRGIVGFRVVVSPFRT